MIPSHPADETLAAFVDGRLTPRGREAVLEHLVACDDCRSIFDALCDAQEAGVIERAEPVVVRGDFGRRAVIAALAAAAVVAVVFTPPVRREIDFHRTGGVSTLVDAAEQTKKRTIEGRLAGGFPYKPYEEPKRSGQRQDPLDDLTLTAAKFKVEDRASSDHAKGLAHLLTGEREAAIHLLERAAANGDPRVLSDLAAAYLEAHKWDPEGGYAVRARDAAQRSLALARTPEAAWNLAVAYQALDDRANARKAWQDYLQLDPSSPWAADVRDHYLPDLDM